MSPLTCLVHEHHHVKEEHHSTKFVLMTMTHVRLFYIFILPPLILAIEWEFDEFKNVDGTPFTGIEGPTVIEQGPDLRYYVGSKEWVYALQVDENYVVRDLCRSESIGAHRTVLGLTFEPRKFEASDIYLYIATSTLNWGGGQQGDPESIPGGWKNGMVQIMRSNIGGHCLGVTKNLVTGLSVSNHDHGINGMVVGNNGKLYVLNGGMTNAGHSEKGDGDGGSPDTPLSAALLEVNYNKVGFIGDVFYDSDDGRVANIVNKPDVRVYAAGFLNALPIVLHMNKGMYTVDNGPNPGYGKESVSCIEHTENEPHYQDKFLRIRKNAWYGHPNRNRGRKDKKQCVFQPLGSRTKGVERELAVVESSTNGLVEYTSGKLGRKYKGCMMLTRIGFGESGNSFILKLDKRGKRVKEREEIGNQGGLAVMMDRFANLVVTDYMVSRIKVLKPSPDNPAEGVVVYSVLPRRGPPQGGNLLWISGRFVGSGVRVLVGSRICADVVVVNEGLIGCRVPRGNPGDRVSVSVGVGGEWSNGYGRDYSYMKRRTNGGLLPHML